MGRSVYSDIVDNFVKLEQGDKQASELSKRINLAVRKYFEEMDDEEYWNCSIGNGWTIIAEAGNCGRDDKLSFKYEITHSKHEGSVFSLYPHFESVDSFEFCGTSKEIVSRFLMDMNIQDFNIQDIKSYSQVR